MAPPKVENGDDSQSTTPEYRDRLRTWLIKMIDSGTIPGLQWENEEKTIFRMPWKHAGRQDYSLEEDSRIFMAWAIHSGRYREGIDKPEPIIWKTRLRCALNKMPDIREIPERSRLDISEPYRVYHLLPPVHKDTQIRRRLQRRHSNAQPADALRVPSQHTSPSFSCKDSTSQSSIRQLKFEDPRLQVRSNENALGTNRPEFPHTPRFDLRNSVPWLGSSPLLHGAENRLLQGLNLNSFTTPPNFRNLVNPYSLFSSVPHRDLRHRPELDFTLFPYQNPVLEHQPLHPFLMPTTGTSLAGLPFGAKPNAASAAISRNLSIAKSSVEKAQYCDRLNNVRPDEKEEAKCKIELLELEITKWKRAYEKERLAREEIEKKHEQLKNALENVGGDILAIIKRGFSQATIGDAKNDDSPSPKSMAFLASPVPFRRRSADDNNHASSSISADVTSRSGRHSTEEQRGRFEPKNDWSVPEKTRRRPAKENNLAKALDLSSPSPMKRLKYEANTPCEDVTESEDRFRGYSAVTSSENGASSNTPKEQKNPGRSFRFSASSSRISSDCDDAEASPSAISRPLVKSPSVSSNCSSAEESVLGASLSPSTARVSPLMPMFRSSTSNPYPSYSGRVDGPIQVT